MLRKFNINILSRLFFLAVLLFLTIYCFDQKYFVTGAITLALIVIVFISLAQYVNQTNRDIATFLESIQYNDFGTNFTSKERGKSFKDLYSSFSTINQKFKEIRAEKEVHHQYLTSIVEQIDIGILVVDHEQKVILMNNALKTLLHKSYLIDLSMLHQVDSKLFEKVDSLPVGERRVIKIIINNELLQLAIRKAELKLREGQIQIFTFQNIRQELEEQELIAWQKLIRILTHEIMNSITPVVSLSSTIQSLLDNRSDEMGPLLIKDIQDGIQAIRKRSEGLLHFTETYRSLTKVPPPQFREVNIVPLINRIHTLFKAELKQRGIPLQVDIKKEQLYFEADPELIEQVIINLVKNAMEALGHTKEPLIIIRAYKELQNKTVILINDNGPGIDQESLDQIFVPFYTTKPSGTGIGLSLSRQIIQAHRGNISVQSKEGEGTTFKIQI